MLCSIADVYDAMRSQRAYQQAFPSDRILEVMKRNDGQQFDQHLVRRFTQLLGIYPPGNLVRLDNGAIAVVMAVHAPEPFKPRVKVIATPTRRAHRARRSRSICGKCRAEVAGTEGRQGAARSRRTTASTR